MHVAGDCVQLGEGGAVDVHRMRGAQPPSSFCSRQPTDVNLTQASTGPRHRRVQASDVSFVVMQTSVLRP